MVKSLLQICVDNIIERVAVGRSNGSIENDETIEQVQVSKCWLGQIPSTIAYKLVCDARLQHDNLQGVWNILCNHRLHIQ